MKILSQRSRRFLGSLFLAPLVPLTITGLLLAAISSGNAWTGPIPEKARPAPLKLNLCYRTHNWNPYIWVTEVGCYNSSARESFFTLKKDPPIYCLCHDWHVVFDINPTQYLADYTDALRLAYQASPPFIRRYEPPMSEPGWEPYFIKLVPPKLSSDL